MESCLQSYSLSYTIINICKFWGSSIFFIFQDYIFF